MPLVWVIGFSTLLTAVVTRSVATGVVGAIVLACSVCWNTLTRVWVPTTASELQRWEAEMLAKVKGEVKHLYIKVREGVILHTLHVVGAPPASANDVPLVLLHGFGGGSGLWAKNLDVLSTGRTVYCIDMLGFGRSSRPPFMEKDPQAAIRWWVDSIEAWRVSMGIERMVLLGHSLGGYIAGHYGLLYPSRLQSLILLSPFGLVNRKNKWGQLSLRLRLTKYLVTKTSPFIALRLLGPFGPGLLFRFRGAYDNGRYDFGDNRAASYAYHLAANGGGSGDYAFMSLVDQDVNVIVPFLEHITQLQVPFTVISGTSDRVTGHYIQEIEERAKGKKFLVFPVVNGDHHIYATQPDVFHNAVAAALALS